MAATRCCFKVTPRVDYLGFASRRNLHICLAAAHPPGGSRGEDGVGEGGAGAGGGAARPPLQCTLPGERGVQVDHVWTVGVEKQSLCHIWEQLGNTEAFVGGGGVLSPHLHYLSPHQKVARRKPRKLNY